MRSVFDVSYQELPAQARELYRALGLHPGPEFHLTAASAAAGLSTSALREPLAVLLDANLLQEVRADRFRFHDLIRLHAKEKAGAECTAERRRDVVLRVVEHYIRRARAAAELCTPHLRGAAYDFAHPAVDSADFTGHREALDWLEAERANLVGGVRAAVGHGLPAAAWQLGHVLWPLFRYRGHHADWLTVDELCLTAARELDAPQREARTARRLAMLHHRRGAWAEAARLLDRSGELFTATRGRPRHHGHPRRTSGSRPGARRSGHGTRLRTARRGRVPRARLPARGRAGTAARRAGRGAGRRSPRWPRSPARRRNPTAGVPRRGPVQLGARGSRSAPP
ncbi:hypothetical protein OOZ19_05180 [Saccharopolyspora sp. NFXS83]|uniref:hypothetical protein n=1 Tax=Saccharopolyspora sp. NFXS83 TaxID=2993560 RepID=UPI00224B403A|nr:hypothetical protein [Saccharopolyspora sp. NFXS83]MCX2729621.1 hypothetical protein [Saccharopolyspora sp. NFXS83]